MALLGSSSSRIIVGRLRVICSLVSLFLMSSLLPTPAYSYFMSRGTASSPHHCRTASLSPSGIQNSARNSLAFSRRRTAEFLLLSLSKERKTEQTLEALIADESSAISFDWDFVDAVYIITTTISETTRLQRTKEELLRANLWDKIQVRKFVPDDEDRVRGCYTSHIKVMQKAQRTFKNKKNYRVLILEDNLETTDRLGLPVLEAVSSFVKQGTSLASRNWDIFHLAYMMYVPGLSLSKLDDDEDKNWSNHVVKMLADSRASVGTSAYLISRSGVEKMLEKDRKEGYTEAIPNVMASLFPQTRYAAYPMPFHRAAKIGSLVNPQLDSFRQVMFNRNMYSTWERLMVGTGLQNNQLFPGLTISLLATMLIAIYSAFTGGSSNDPLGSFLSSSAQAIVVFPLFVALWGASLFKPGNTGAGFAQPKNME